jgi:excisionase family DNA binding protein
MPDEQHASKRCLTVKETAERLGVCPHTVYTLVREGDLPAFRVRNQWRVTELTLAQYMQAENPSPLLP